MGDDDEGAADEGLEVTGDLLLALDVGGTSTRAVLVDRSGVVHGFGRAGAGNPTAVGIPAAVEAIGSAAETALRTAPGDPGPLVPAALAMAGEKTALFADQVGARLGRIGVGPVSLGHDLLAIFCSGTHRLDGYALIAGTGSVAARISGGQLERVVGGRGWLLGDAGSGFWIGHAAVRAVIASLDGQVADTALVAPVLERFEVDEDLGLDGGRERALRKLLSAVYAQPPVALAALAPLVFLVAGDPVAADILDTGAAALADLLHAVWRPDRPGPVVVGGSVVVQGWLGAPAEVAGRLVLAVDGDSLIPVSDGLVGAAVLALREAGVVVDEGLFERLRAGILALRGSG